MALGNGVDGAYPRFRARPPWWGADLQTLRNHLCRLAISLDAYPAERLEFPMRDGSDDALLAILNRPVNDVAGLVRVRSESGSHPVIVTAGEEACVGIELADRLAQPRGRDLDGHAAGGDRRDGLLVAGLDDARVRPPPEDLHEVGVGEDVKHSTGSGLTKQSEIPGPYVVRRFAAIPHVITVVVQCTFGKKVD